MRFPVGRLCGVCSGIIVPAIKHLLSGRRATCDCLPTSVGIIPRKGIVASLLDQMNFDRTHSRAFAFNVYSLCANDGNNSRAAPAMWVVLGLRIVRGCNLVKCPLKRSFSGGCFGRGFRSRGVSTACLGFRVPGVGSLGAMLGRGPRLGNLGIAVPCGRRIVPCLSSLSRSTHLVKTIGIVGFAGNLFNGGLGNCGSSVVNFGHSVRPLLGRARHGTLVLKANNTSGTIFRKLGRLNINTALISHGPGRRYVACRRVAPGAVRRCAIVIGAAPLNVCPGVGTYPSVPCSLLAPSRLLCSLLCGPSRALFVGGKGRGKTIIGGNLRVLLLRTFTT